MISLSASLVSTPNILWNYYLDYLWHFSADSWVAQVAYTFRVFAVLLILPLVVLALLDIASYGIARTLGVVDDVKASTTDHKLTTARPTITIVEPSSSQSSLSPSVDSDHSSDTSMPAYFTSEARNLKLSGVGVFSPAPSQPPSPTMSRRRLHPDVDSLAPMTPLDGDQALTLRKKARKPVDT